MRRRSFASPVWLFDLDNTLHDAQPHIFPHLNRTMTAYLQTHLAVDLEQANLLRVQYWRRYGATLLGLMRHHNVDPTHFLWETHQFPELSRMVLRHPLLKLALTRLPGRKLVFSNAPVHYSSAVLKILGIEAQFEDIFSIEHTGYRPKPDQRGFRMLLKKHHLNPRSCVMVEDTLVNLKTAKRLGMRTVWVSSSVKAPAYVDLTIRHVKALPRALGRLGIN